MAPIRVVLAEDHALVRAGLRSLLDAIPGVAVTGEASDGQETLRLVAALRPDVLLLDITMPGLNGLDVCARVSREHPATRVLILSMHQSEEYVRHAFRAGAVGYLIKQGDPEDLVMALRALERGERYLSPAVPPAVVAAIDRESRDAGPLDRLTPRQREILQLVAEGASSKDVAGRLGLSVKTVESHRTEVMRRLDVHDLAGLVRLAVREGLVSADS